MADEPIMDSPTAKDLSQDIFEGYAAAGDKTMSPSSTPAVKSRLESWKSPSPTKEDIENRMDAANQLREMNLSAPVAKNNARFEKVNQNKVVLGETMRKALEDKRVEIDGRLTAASKKVENMVKCRVEKVADHNSKVLCTKETVTHANSMKTSQLLDSHVRKLEVATANHENVMAKKILTAAEHNEGVKVKHVRVLSGEELRAHELAKANDVKMTNAINSKQNMITEKVMAVGQTTRNKGERGKQALAAQQAKAEALKENLTVKIERADAKRDEIIKEKVLKSAVKKVSPKATSSPKADAEALQERMEDAAARREALLMMRSEQCGVKNSKVKQVSDEVKKSPQKKKYGTPGKKLHKENDIVGFSAAEAVEPEEVEVQVEVEEAGEETDGVEADDANNISVESEDGTVGGGNCVVA
ncbi:hypothetical protein TrRE_jg10461 [Triparma retinervis]|uniref:Uncharacterized protein n=1 Tax=Triparma retinervis TaxID=2557542 RepID=A0A9W6ZTH6_9STRA|nr:hypothetical protein TrRE_jg10461 [Triparma retinervis]